MAIDTEAASFLLASAKNGVSFANCATLGRQNYLPGNTESRRLLKHFGHDPSRFPKLFTGEYPNRYAEPFFEVLGAKRLETIDASDFEGATLVHDFNQPIPERLVGQFDVVYDGGTLEHVFHFLTGITNCMRLVKVGGTVFLHTTANNYFGHGFYQFSPELFFRIFCKANGFVVDRLIAVEYGPLRRCYDVSDPAVIRERVPLINSFPVLLFVQAHKEADVPLFQQCPQQSDYSTMWVERKEGGKPPGPSSVEKAVISFKHALIENTPWVARWLEAWLFSSLNRQFSFRNRKAFKPLRKG